MLTQSIRIGCLAMVALLLAMPLSADEFEDFRRSEMGDFTHYRDERDSEFVEFLEAQWTAFEASKGFVRERVPKPRSLPAAPLQPPAAMGDKEKKAEPLTLVGEIVLPILPETLPPEPEGGEGGIILVDPFSGAGDDLGGDSFFQGPQRVGMDADFGASSLTRPPLSQPEEMPLLSKVSPLDEPSSMEEVPVPVGLAVEFFGENFLFQGEFSFPEIALTDPLERAIASYWEAMSRTSKFEDFLSQAQAIGDRLDLNDWGYHNFLFSSGMAVHGGDRDLANLFTWFMSVKSGFDARVGYSDGRVYLLLPSRNRLYGISYLTLQGARYYAMTFNGTKETLGRVYTYKGKYPRSERLMDYRILKIPALKPDILEKELVFDFNGESQSLKVAYNKVLVDYYRYYPQTNIKIYFDAVASKELNYSMVRGLKIKLEGKSEKEAVDYLLGLSQKGFAYKTDDAQLGREKYMLPEETLWYPYSDCEDRAFLFAYLVRRILKLDVVGLNYPGHVATAVRFSDNISGDYVVMNNRKYIVCDPTYINASAGMSMPKYKRRNPDVIKIRNWRND